MTDDECIVFACTLQQRNLPRKIRTDVDAVMHGAPVTSIYVFCEADVQVGERHALQKWAVDTHRVRLEIIDGTGLAEALSTAEMFPIAREHLGLPRSMAPRHRSRLWLIVAVVLSLVGGSVVAWESWKAEPPPAVHLSTVAGTASWTSRAGQIEFNGNDPSNDDGYVAPAVEDLEDGTVRAGGLIMHPSWENYGFIRGCFQLSEPLAANDRFRSRAGFIREYADAGNVRFRVTVADNKGNVRIVADETDDRANEQMVEFDLSLADYAGLSTLCIEVLANGDAGQDAAFWHDPRIVSSANHL
ncbi:hypothetical protein [Herbidospora sp. NBRC 101105]|uniref:hypothetical protein n=1 Tax=Herbidospora sp. NBRC 101105 TaxID=3032195 RepID=UPI00255476F8|nr:hypothetical protein [Herbidospora sp. NBRC 101105]